MLALNEPNPLSVDTQDMLVRIHANDLVIWQAHNEHSEISVAAVLF